MILELKINPLIGKINLVEGVGNIVTRTIHELGGQGFCATHNRPVTFWVGYFSSRNRPVTVTVLLVLVIGWRSSVLGEPDIHRCPAKCSEILLDLARSC